MQKTVIMVIYLRITLVHYAFEGKKEKKSVKKDYGE